MASPKDYKYTDEHEWVKNEGSVYAVGITAHAAELLGDITYVDLPAIGAEFSAGEESATVESVKAASDVYAPVSGRVVEVNEALVDNPALVNEDPYAAWFYKLADVEAPDVDALMDAEVYDRLVAENG